MDVPEVPKGARHAKSLDRAGGAAYVSYRLETEIVTGIGPAEASSSAITRDFRNLLESGVSLQVAGSARSCPESLLRQGYSPKHRIERFDAVFFLTNMLEDENFRFFVAYVWLAGTGRRSAAHARLFYKDSSLVWRSATHYIRTADENWIGKGALKWFLQDGEEVLNSAEETTNLPLEMQGALDVVSRRGGRVRRDLRAAGRVLRNAPDGRYEPNADFTSPRRRAQANPRNRINRDRPVARFMRGGDPASLRFAPGFAPDFSKGVIEVIHSRSRLYHGDVRKFRILSQNRKIQYQFIASAKHVWIIPPQTLTRELSTYGLRTVDVEVDEDVCVPGYEYHFIDDNQDLPTLHTQIPAGFAGPASKFDPTRASAAPWLDQLPVIREFRRRVLGRR